MKWTCVLLKLLAHCYFLKAKSMKYTAALEGDSAAFNCTLSIMSNESPFWIIADGHYALVDLPLRHSYNPSLQQLTVSNVTLSDNGTTYQCAAFPNDTSDIAILIVMSAPTVRAHISSAGSIFYPTTAAAATTIEATATTLSTVPTNSFDGLFSNAISALATTSKATKTILTNATTTIQPATSNAASSVTTSVTTRAQNSMTWLIAVIITTSVLLVIVLSLALLPFYCWRQKMRDSLDINPTQEVEIPLSNNNYIANELQDQELTNEESQDNSHARQLEGLNACSPIYDVIAGDTQNNSLMSHESQSNTEIGKINSNGRTYDDRNNSTATRKSIPVYNTVINEHGSSKDDTYSTLQHNFIARSTLHNTDACVRPQKDITSTSIAIKPDESHYSSLNYPIKVSCHNADQYDVLPACSAAESAVIVSAEATYSSLDLQSTSHSSDSGGISLTHKRSNHPKTSIHQNIASPCGNYDDIKLDDTLQDANGAEPVYSMVDKAKKNLNYNIVTVDSESMSVDCIDQVQLSSPSKMKTIINQQPHDFINDDVTDATDGPQLTNRGLKQPN